MCVYVCSGSNENKNPFCDCNYEHSENVCILLFYYLFFCAQADILLKKKKRKRGSYACMLVVLLRVAQINIHIFFYFLCAYVSGGWFEFNISYVYLSYVQNLR